MVKDFLKSLTSLAVVHARLFSMDIADEKNRFIKLTFDLVFLAVFSVLFLLMLSGVVGLYCWQYSPLYTLLGLTLFYFLGLLMLIYRIYHLVNKSGGLSYSLTELEKSLQMYSDNQKEE